MPATPRLLGWILLTWTAGGAFAASAQERDRLRIPDRFKWDLTKVYPSDDAWREAKEKLTASLPRLREFKGQLATSPAKLADALELVDEPVEGTVAHLRLREHEVRRGHPGQQVPGHAAGDDPAGRRPRRRNVVHGAGDPQDRSGRDRRDSSRRSRGWASIASTSTTSSAGAPTPAPMPKNGCWPAPRCWRAGRRRSTASCRTPTSLTRR